MGIEQIGAVGQSFAGRLDQRSPVLYAVGKQYDHLPVGLGEVAVEKVGAVHGGLQPQAEVGAISAEDAPDVLSVEIVVDVCGSEDVTRSKSIACRRDDRGADGAVEVDDAEPVARQERFIRGIHLTAEGQHGVLGHSPFVERIHSAGIPTRSVGGRATGPAFHTARAVDHKSQAKGLANNEGIGLFPFGRIR